jgi:signal transduction histidine kinase
VDLAPLRRIPLFAGLDDAELGRLAAVADTVDLAPGAILIREGEAGDALFVVLAGELAVSKRSGTTDVPLAVVGPGEVQGELAVLEGRPRTATVRAVGPATLLRLRRDALLDVLGRQPELALALLRTTAGRLRSTESLLREREKLAGLGTLAAGLAHELNNPVAAIRSTVARLAALAGEWDRASVALGALGPDDLDPDGVAREVAAALRDELDRRAAEPLLLDPLDAADREDVLVALLDRLGIARPAEPAATLVAFGWDGNQLDDVLAPFESDEARHVVLAWLAAGALGRQLLGEIGAAAERIGEIVASVREYSYLDRAPVGDVDVIAGIESTLVMLRPRLKGGIEVRRSYPAVRPRIEAFGSELNQVWTNLVVNAADAMEGRGVLEIAVREDAPPPTHADSARLPGSVPEGAPGVVVEVCDSGSGIPEDVRARIFEPFFTTKDVGAGSGLGLHIVRSIVERHAGRIDVLSVPGHTCFTVTLPGRVPPGS